MKIKEAKLRALRKTKKWIMITKIQAHVWGWSLRLRKKRGLMNVRIDIDDDLDDHLGFFDDEDKILKQVKDFELEIPDDNPEMQRMF